MVRTGSILKTKILFLRGGRAQRKKELPLICLVDYNVEFYPKQRKGSILRFTLGARKARLSIYSFEFYYSQRKTLSLCIYIFLIQFRTTTPFAKILSAVRPDFMPVLT